MFFCFFFIFHHQSLLSCVAFGYGCENFSKYEQQGIGIQWSNINESPEEGERYTFMVSIIMMLFDAVFYWLLTWYIENVFPGMLIGMISLFAFCSCCVLTRMAVCLLHEGPSAAHRLVSCLIKRRRNSCQAVRMKRTLHTYSLKPSCSQTVTNVCSHRPVWNPKAVVLPFHCILLVWDNIRE